MFPHFFSPSMYTSVNLAMLFWLGLLASDHHNVFKNIFILLQKVAFFCGGSWPSSSLAHSHPLFPGHCGGNHPLSMGTGLSFIWFWINHLCQWSLIIIVCCFDPLLSPSSPLGVNGSVAVTTHCSWVIIIWFLSSVESSLIIYCICCYQYAGCDNNCSLSKVKSARPLTLTAHARWVVLSLLLESTADIVLCIRSRWSARIGMLGSSAPPRFENLLKFYYLAHI